MATQFRPEALRVGAERLMALLNPDGQFSDADRARRRGITTGPQGFGMSAISGLLDPETRAYLDTVFAKLAAPGMCNPNDQSPLGRPTRRRCRRTRYPHRGTTPPRRPTRSPALHFGEHRAGFAPRTTRHRDRHHHTQRVARCGWDRHHRLRHPPPHAGPDPRCRTRPPLPGDLRRPRPCPTSRAFSTHRLPRISASCYTPATVAAPTPTAMCPDTSAKPTTSPNAPTTAPPTSTTQQVINLTFGPGADP